jgi:hypothetical protein
MKLCVKKIYCPHCRQAVKGVEPPYTGPCRVLCSKCGQAICVSNGTFWRPGQAGESIPVTETKGGSAGKAKKTKPPKTKPGSKLSTSPSKGT